MNGSEQNEAMEQQIAGALERRPPVAVPAGFAARVSQALTPGPSLHRVPRAGKTVAAVAAVLLAAALFALAPHAGPSFSNVGFDVELLVLAELGAVVWVLGRMQAGWL
jgi:hypothetical protein